MDHVFPLCFSYEFILSVYKRLSSSCMICIPNKSVFKEKIQIEN